jgi:endonuclease G
MKKLITLIGMFLCLNTFGQLPRQISMDDQIIEYNGFTISYNNSHEQPNWVLYRIDSTDVACETKAKRKNKFVEDFSIKGHSAYLDDYKGSGYDRGHLKASADESCDQEQMNETFVMSNMSPQNPSFNRGGWKKLESYVRTLPLVNDSVFVITGPILTDGLETIGFNKVTVPEFFFKLIYIYKDGKLEVICFLMPNEKITDPLYGYKVELKAIEKLAGIDFPEKF